MIQVLNYFSMEKTEELIIAASFFIRNNLMFVIASPMNSQELKFINSMSSPLKLNGPNIIKQAEKLISKSDRDYHPKQWWLHNGNVSGPTTQGTEKILQQLSWILTQIEIFAPYSCDSLNVLGIAKLRMDLLEWEKFALGMIKINEANRLLLNGLFAEIKAIMDFIVIENNTLSKQDFERLQILEQYGFLDSFLKEIDKQKKAEAEIMYKKAETEAIKARIAKVGKQLPVKPGTKGKLPEIPKLEDDETPKEDENYELPPEMNFFTRIVKKFEDYLIAKIPKGESPVTLFLAVETAKRNFKHVLERFENHWKEEDTINKAEQAKQQQQSGIKKLLPRLPPGLSLGSKSTSNPSLLSPKFKKK